MNNDPSIGALRFGAALVIAHVLKALAVLTLIAGVILVAVRFGEDNGAGVESVAIAVYAIATSAGLGFFAYVLEILVAIFDQIWHLRFPDEDEDEDELQSVP